jgi:Flp pilus assembly protein TadD
MTARKAVVTGVALLAVALGCAGCRGQATSAPSGSPSQTGSSQAGSSQAENDLNSIQTTLDAIDSEMAGDGSP